MKNNAIRTHHKSPSYKTNTELPKMINPINTELLNTNSQIYKDNQNTKIINQYGDNWNQRESKLMKPEKIHKDTPFVINLQKINNSWYNIPQKMKKLRKRINLWMDLFKDQKTTSIESRIFIPQKMKNQKTETRCKEKTLTFTQTLKSIEDQLYSSRKWI